MLDVEINTVCNLRCRTCFVDGYGRFEAPLTVPRSRIRTIMSAGIRQYGGVLHLMGGEPLLHPELQGIISDGLELGYTGVLVNTNGTCVTPVLAAQLAAFGCVEVFVSLDGPQPLNDGIRGRGVYRKAVQAVRDLHEAGVPTSVMVTVTRGLLPDLSVWLDDLRELDCLEAVHLMPVGHLARDARPREAGFTEPLSAAELLRLYFVSWLHRPFTRITEDPLVNLFYLKMGVRPQKGDQCGACTTRLAVQADGSVSPCHPSNLSFGRFEPGKLDALTRLPVFQRIAGNDFDLCRDCAYNDVCGMCSARVYAATGDPLGSTPVCVELRQLLGLAA